MNRYHKFIRVQLSAVLIATLLAFSQSGIAETGTPVIRWNEVTLQAIRVTNPGPTIAARALAVVNTCMFDAWAAYDPNAKGTRLGETLRRRSAERTNANKEKAISFAAQLCLADLFPSERQRFDNLMGEFGFDQNDNTAASGIGKVAAKAVLRFRHHDGSNQLGDLNPGAYSDYTDYRAVNEPDRLNDLNHWQPLTVGNIAQTFMTPHWGKVIPYALSSGSQFRKITPAPADYYSEPERYEIQARQILEYSANLTDERKAIAEYWADGPNSELPPGHWILFTAYVSKRDHHNLDQDVKVFFAVSNALFDASIVAWDAKRFFDYVRPVSAINFLYAGQSVESWQGTIQGEDWRPYQSGTAATPPFPEYFSGHSMFSAAGAETLKLFTNNDFFGFAVTITKGSSKVESEVPANDTILYWATFSDAADEAGISRRYRGIHFIDGDLVSRKIGRLVGQQAWEKTLKYFGARRENPRSHRFHHRHSD